MIEEGTERILFDPFFPLSNKIFKPSIEELSAANHILVTHGHFDHINGIPDIMSQECNNSTVYCTKTPRDTLIKKGILDSRVRQIAVRDVLNIGPFEICVLKGKHIIFDKWLVAKTLFNLRMLAHLKNLKHIIKENKKCAEGGETVVYDINASNKRVLLMGSCSLDDNTEYPGAVDLLMLPFQGRSNICKYAMRFADRLKPKKIMLTHFDNSFPPISSFVNAAPFISAMEQKYPDIPVICQPASSEWVEI